MNINQMEFIKNCTNKYNDCKICIVTSHSCDIARDADKEPTVEVLPCHNADKLDGLCLFGRNCRRLNFSLNLENEQKYYYIDACEKTFITKIEFDDVNKIEVALCDLEISFFQNWLAARYRRQTLPDNVNTKIDKLKLNRKLKNVREELLAIFIEEEAVDDIITIYTLFFVSDYSNSEAVSKVDKLVDKLNAILEKLPEDGVELVIIHIQSIELNYNEQNNYSIYNCDYLCVDVK
jgi:hypothetical protein